MNLEPLCKQAISVIEEVARFIHQENRNLTQEKICFKGKNDLVTYVDTTSEKKLIEGLGKIFPEAGFLTEEKTATKSAPFQWVIDPLDGTTNYVHGVPLYSISVALMEGEKVVLGIVYEVCRQECFYSFGNRTSYLNGKEIRVSSVSPLQNGLLVTGFPYSNFTRITPYLDLFRYLLERSQGMRRLGSAAADLAYVACGRFEGFYEYNLNPWDVAAGAFIVEQAGGKVSDFKGGNQYIFGQEIVAANDAVYPELMEAVRRFFP